MRATPSQVSTAPEDRIDPSWRLRIPFGQAGDREKHHQQKRHGESASGPRAVQCYSTLRSANARRPRRYWCERPRRGIMPACLNPPPSTPRRTSMTQRLAFWLTLSAALFAAPACRAAGPKPPAVPEGVAFRAERRILQSRRPTSPSRYRPADKRRRSVSRHPPHPRRRLSRGHSSRVMTVCAFVSLSTVTSPRPSPIGWRPVPVSRRRLRLQGGGALAAVQRRQVSHRPGAHSASPAARRADI